MKNKFINGRVLLIIILIIHGCSKDDTNPTSGGAGSISTANGVFIINEGGFLQSNGSVTFFKPSIHEIIDDVFMKVNNRVLGDVVQSMTIFNDKGYIVVNNSRTVEMVNKNTFVSEGVITGFASPRFFLPVNNDKAYVSDWSDNNIKIVDLNSLSITGSIPAGNGPEQMKMINNKVYVTNVGGFTIDSTVTVIDPATDAVITTIPVGLNPNSLSIDINGKLWILCSGWYGPDYTGGTGDDVEGQLIRINPVSDLIEDIFPLGQFDHPVKMTINNNKNTLYYLMSSSSFDGSVYKFNINDSVFAVSPIVNKNFYGLGIDPLTEDIYAAFSPSFTQAGYMFRYKNDGTLKDSIKAGIGPNGFAFNYN
jgi:YVTN family beta-propeller protein